MPALMDHHQIARDLIELESITGNEEPVVAYLEKRLGELGLEVRSEEVAPGRRNLIAGPENPALLFCTHTDTVPPYVPLSEDEEYIYGRGACDTKGITACFLAAGERLLSEGLDDFGYLFVVGEEIDNIGAVAANRSVRCGHVVVGEPTENKLALGHKGVLGARVKVEGRACHSAYPAEGDSAIHRLLGYLQQVLRADFGSSHRQHRRHRGRCGAQRAGSSGRRRGDDPSGERYRRGGEAPRGVFCRPRYRRTG